MMSAATETTPAVSQKENSQQNEGPKTSPTSLEPSCSLFQKRRKSSSQACPKKVAFTGVEENVNKKQTDFKRQDTPISYDIEVCPDLVAV